MPPSPEQQQQQQQHTSNDLDLGNTVAVTQDHTNLRRRSALLGELADLLDDLLGRGLEPRRGVAAVGHSGGADTLSVGVHATHFGGLGGSVCIGGMGEGLVGVGVHTG